MYYCVDNKLILKLAILFLLPSPKLSKTIFLVMMKIKLLILTKVGFISDPASPRRL